MKMLLNQIKSRWIYILLGVVVLFVGILAHIIPSESLFISTNQVFSLNDQWRISVNDANFSNISLPMDLNLNRNDLYTIERALPADLPSNALIRLRASMQQFTVKIDGVKIYDNYRDNPNKLKSPEASLWYFITLPEGSAGKTIQLEWQSSILAFSGLLNPIYYGSGDALMYDVLKTYKWGIFVGILLILIGGIATIISYFIVSLKDNRALFLGIFSMLVGTWVLSEARVMQFLTGNRFLIGGISYMMLSLLPIPFLLYIRETVLKKYHNWFYIPVIAFLGTFFVNITLQLTGICPFIESIIVTHSLMVLTLIVVMGFVVREAIVFKSLPARKFIVYISVLVVAFLFEVIQFIYQNFDVISVYSRLGIVLFFILLILDTFKYFDQLMESEKEAKILLKLAYLDILTGAFNRTAFQKDIELLVTQPTSSKYRLILFDINDLKVINDQYGHFEGDKAIKNSYRCICSSVGELGKVYRIGGDEFAGIITNTDNDCYESIIKSIHKQLSDLKDETPYVLDIAIGSEVFDDERFKDFESLFVYTDKLMYHNKRMKE